MDKAKNRDDRPTHPDPGQQPDERHLSQEQADALLEQNRKQGASGLSWDQVAADDRNGWRQATEMGEGD